MMRNIPGSRENIPSLNIDTNIKRLTATLLKMNVQEFLITSDFTYLCMETNTQELWENLKNEVISESNVAILIPGYKGYAKKTLPRFLQIIYNKEKNFLPFFLTELIKKGSRVIKNEHFPEIAQRVEDLGFSAHYNKKSISFFEVTKEKTDDDKVDSDLLEELEMITSTISKDIIQALLPQDLKEKGKDMAEAYIFLYCVENSLRIFIDKVLRDKYKKDYFSKVNVNRGIREKVKSRKEEEKKRRWLPTRGEIEIYYLDFLELGNLIQNNWDDFKSYFPSQQWILQKIYELSETRHFIAHNSVINRDQKDLIRLYYRQILSQIESIGLE